VGEAEAEPGRLRAPACIKGLALSNVHGYPRIGPRRELKFATESCWAGEGSAEELQRVAREIRRTGWERQRDAGIDLIPSNDFSFYDQVLDTTALVGAVPPRFGHAGGEVDLDTYFAMARGRQDATAMEMTKWFDTNYHYIVPELGPGTEFALSSSKPFDEYREARALGIETKPVLVGPVTYLLLSKAADEAPQDFAPLGRLDSLLAVYAEAIARLGELGASWVELHEPALVLERSGAELDAVRSAYERLAAVEGRPSIAVATYFEHAGDSLRVLRELPIEGVGLDFVRGDRNVELLRDAGGLGGKALFAGVVDGRNVWTGDLRASLGLLDELRSRAERVVVSTSCSLQHVPYDVDAEPTLDTELRGSPLPSRSSGSWRPWHGLSTIRPRGSPSWTGTPPCWMRGAPRAELGIPRSAGGWRGSPRTTLGGRAASPSGAAASDSRSGCPCSPPRRSGPTPRRRTFVRRVFAGEAAS
jgi:5-methyltetrahydropteroyltriglutamate--homocysteine methyltransferase